MTTPKRVTDLKGWPEVGQTYLVPTVLWEPGPCAGDWPVMGRAHVDQDNPAPRHYHTDPRFLSEEQEAAMADAWRSLQGAVATAQRYPQALAQSQHPDSIKGALLFAISATPGRVLAKAKLKPLVCRRSTVAWDAPPRDHHWPAKDVSVQFAGGKATALRGRGGRPLCPHQRFDLTAVWDGKQQKVRFPLHDSKST